MIPQLAQRRRGGVQPAPRPPLRPPLAVRGEGIVKARLRGGPLLGPCLPLPLRRRVLAISGFGASVWASIRSEAVPLPPALRTVAEKKVRAAETFFNQLQAQLQGCGADVGAAMPMGREHDHGVASASGGRLGEAEQRIPL